MLLADFHLFSRYYRDFQNHKKLLFSQSYLYGFDFHFPLNSKIVRITFIKLLIMELQGLLVEIPLNMRTVMYYWIVGVSQGRQHLAKSG